MNLQKKSLLALLLIFAAQFILSAQSMPPVGLELYSLRNQFAKDVPGTMAKVKAMGITNVEVAGTYGMSTQEFRKLLDANGLKVIGTSADFDKLQQDLKPIISDAKALGAKYVVCFWIPHTGNDFTLENAKKAVEVFNKAGKELKAAGLNLAYHPHGYEFRPHGNGTLFDYMVQNMNPQYVNFEMDVFWIKHPGQDPVALLKKYPGRFKLMHLKDRKPGTPGNQNGEADVETNVVLGKGDVGISEIVKAAKKAGVEYMFIEDESSRSEAQIPQSLAFLKTVK
jgi:sugar phosphate isomerase/epimerase